MPDNSIRADIAARIRDLLAEGHQTADEVAECVVEWLSDEHDAEDVRSIVSAALPDAITERLSAIEYD